MKTKITTIIALFGVLLLVGCSTKKNTASRRFYHSFTTRFNVFFNGNESYKKGYDKIEKAYSPDYSHTIDMFAVSNPATKGLGKTDMGITSDKCQKAIKEHSIKKKPKKNMNKTHDPKYMEFYNQEEFNPMMNRVWMLLGKSKYYANDYLGASAIFTYVTKHFSENKDVVAEAMIWKAKSLKEMDWTYEAESVMENIDDEMLSEDNFCLYSAAYADLKIKEKEEGDALKHLKTAIELEKNKKQKNRFKFIAAQIYQSKNENAKAYELYEQVIKSSPDYQMAFNARIRQTEVYDNNDSQKMIKSLSKMAKKSNNKDYLDQIYYAIGNVYLKDKDTIKAIENYKLSIEKSTRNGLDKVLTLVTLGDLYYNNSQYIKAQPCFSEASQIIDQSYPDYNRVNSLSQILGELAQLNNTVELQDSLQALSKMSKSEQIAAANREIEKIKAEEERQRQQQIAEAQKNKQLDQEIENMAVMNKQALGGKATADWYFYNANTIQKGKLEFQRKFGNRRLEDNWNRKNKAMVSFDDSDLTAATEEENTDVKDSTNTEKTKEGKKLTDKNIEFYLRQIPSTDEQLANSDKQIAEALLSMATLYDEKLNDQEKAIETFDEFLRRFKGNEKTPDAYFNCYRISEKLGNTSAANAYKDKLVNEYPNCKYSMILSQPDYRERLLKMQSEQDSIYEATYNKYRKGDYYAVIKTSDSIKSIYPVSPLIPKFILLKSLSEGKLGQKDSLTANLNNLVANYPNSDAASMAKDIIALINQGFEPKEGTSSQLSEKMAMTLTDSVAGGEPTLKAFRFNEKTQYLYYLITNPEEVRENWLLYYTASYNFSKFLVKDFDLNVKNGTLVVSGLDNLDEALWYAQGIDNDADLQNLLKGKTYESLVISQENSELIGRGFTIDDYKKFYQDSILNRKKTKIKTKVELISSQNDSTVQTSSGKIDVKEGTNLMNIGKENPTPRTSIEQKSDSTSNINKVSQQTSIVADSSSSKAIKPIYASDKKEEKQQPAEKKNLKKYKGLYTYDVDAEHKMVLLLTKNDVDTKNIIEELNKYNTENYANAGLIISEGKCEGFSKTIEIGMLHGAKAAKSYLLQVVKNDKIRELMESVPHRRIIISEDNLATLKTTGSINTYMELFRRLYLGR